MSDELDVSSTIVAKSDQLNSEDLIGGPVTVAITDASRGSTDEQPVTLEITGGHKPWKPCKTMRRVLVAAWGKNAASWVGKSLTLYRDPDVKWAGESVGGIRISAMSHIAKAIDMNLAESRKSKKRVKVDVLIAAVTTAEVAAMQKRWLGAVKASGQKATPEGFHQFVYLNTNGDVGAADVTNGAKYSRENLSQCEQAVLEISKPTPPPDRNDLPGSSDPYQGLQQRIRSCRSGAEASEIKVDIAGAIERHDITPEEGRELNEMLMREMT